MGDRWPKNVLDEIERLRREGRVSEGPLPSLPVEPPAVEGEPARCAKVELVKGGFAPPGVWTVPLRVYAGDNASGFKQRIGRSGHERTTCCREFARAHGAWAIFYLHLMSGGRLRVELTRLGGRRMDASNVCAAMKYVQDAVALFCGLDDGDPRYDWRYGAEPGGPFGVRVSVTRV